MQIYRDGRKSTIIIDASALKKSSCVLRTFYITGKGYKKKGMVNNDMHIGSCWHAFRAEYRRTGDDLLAHKAASDLWDEEEVFTKEKKQYVDKKFMQRMCMEYAELYPVDNDGLVRLKDGDDYLIEPKTKFVFPFRCEPDIDVLVAGTQDEVCYWNPSNSYKGGQMVDIIDGKVTGSWNTWKFIEDHLFNPQLILYRWTVKKYAKIKPNSIWEWIDRQPRVGASIDAVFYKAGTQKDDGMPQLTFKRSEPFVFKDWQLEEFELMLNKFVDDLVYWVRVYIKTGKLPPRFGILTDSCKDEFGKCDFCPACAAVDEEQRESYLELNFIEKEYNPLMFGGK